MTVVRRAAAHRSSTRRVARAVALGLAAAATALVAQPASPAAARALTGVDLSTYVRTARLDLPAPWNTTPPAGSLLAQEASSVTYDWDTDSLFVVGDGGTSVVQVDKDTGALIDSMTLSSGAFADTEGIAYAGGGQFVITEERLRQVDRFTYVGGGTLTRAGAETVKLGTTIGNIGLEGVTYDRVADDYILVKEVTPESIFETTLDWTPPGTASNGSDSTDESTDLFTPSLAGLDDFSDVYALSDVTGLTGPDAGHLLMISQESGKIINISRAGVVSSALTIRGDADNALSVQDQTMEGVTLGPDGTLYVVNENGGGTSHPQLWKYQPSLTPNAAPTAVTLSNTTTSLPDTTNTTDRTKVADVTVADDQLGTNDLGVTGPDAADFEVVGSALYLKAGVTLDASAKSSYAVSVTADDTSVGATPDATSSPYTLTVTAGSAGGPVSLAVTEVDPTGSSAAYGADWFELTNTGTTAADLTGFKMDDDTGGAGAAAPLVGVTSLAPGKSAVFVEGTAATATAFEAAWFGDHPPAGLQVGSYTGGGVGLSSSGDQVNVFDGNGSAVTGVAFGASTAGVSFDNAAGLGGTTSPPPTISTLSAVGTHGAFTAGGETGSPGQVNYPLTITEVNPTGNGNSTYKADWFEITNNGTVPVDLTGFKMDDGSNAYGTAVPMVGVSTVAPGQSVVFVEGTATTAAALTATWFGDHPPAGLQVGSYTGSGVGLSNGGDAVNLFDVGGGHVTGVAFGAATDGVTFDNRAGLGAATGTLPTIATLSVAGINGAYAASGETGSPAALHFPLVITEIHPTGSSNSTYAADWFEVTNTGSVPVDLTGFKMDDSSNAFANAVPMAGIASIAPGQSVVYVEGTAPTAAAMKAAWFGPDAPAGVQVGSYTGSGVGLSANAPGDGVTLFDAGGNRATSVAFPAATLGVTFDNSAGLGSAGATPAAVTTLSAVGVGGARVVAGETGSPATIAPDVTAPVITYAGNADNYVVGDTVHITCAAADEAYGSGLDTTDCIDVDAPASAFAIGQNTITTTATDHAGNVGTATVTFTVKAAPVETPAGDGGDTGTTPPPATAPPAVTPPTITPPAVVPPAVMPPAPAPAPAKPKAAAPASAKTTSLLKGVTTTLTHLKAKSKVTLAVRAGGRTVTTIKVTADAKGTGKVKLKLTRRQLSTLHGKTLTLRYTVVGANGRPQRLTTTLKVK